MYVIIHLGLLEVIIECVISLGIDIRFCIAVGTRSHKYTHADRLFLSYSQADITVCFTCLFYAKYII